MMMVSGGMSALGSLAQGNAQASAANADAASERLSAAQHAANLRRATRREVGSARAAIAGSGTALDGFSQINTDDIERLGSQDASQAILSGELRAQDQQFMGKMAKYGSITKATGSLLQGAAYSGWKGVKTPAFFDGTTGDFSQ